MRRLLLLILTTMVTVHAAASPQLLPTSIKDGDTLLLDCGQIYLGELDLSHRQNVTVTTRGDCGHAAITPAQAVTGWKRHPQDARLWSARLERAPLQFEIAGRFMSLAHHPNSTMQWLRGERLAPLRLRAKLPHQSLAGATLVWRAADWLIQSRTIARYDDQVIQLDAGDDEGFGLPPETEFYVEGKPWMLDTPGEWVHADGWLHVWPPDGKSPEGRAWATGRSRAINASGSRNARIQGLTLFAATRGIDGSDSRNLQVMDTRILNSGEEAVLIGGRGARLQRLQIIGTVQHGIRANDDAQDVLITDSHITGAGMLGMPRRSKGAIVFESATDQTILRNHVTDSAYIGIRVFRRAIVEGNTIERACLRLGDCGGIYTFARDRQPLDTLIRKNKISHLQGRASYAIYLDDFSNGVVVSENWLIRNPGGIQLHNGFDNLIEKNRFVESAHEHILFNETAKSAAVSQNRIVGNQFISFKEVPTFRLWSHHGDRHVRRFADFENNTYVSASSRFAEVEGQGMLSYQAWHARISAESRAHFSVPGSFPKLAGESEKK